MHTYRENEPSTSTRAVLEVFSPPVYISIGDPYGVKPARRGRDLAYTGRQFQTRAPKSGVKGARNQVRNCFRCASQPHCARLCCRVPAALLCLCRAAASAAMCCARCV